jgi:hypothetical protein
MGWDLEEGMAYLKEFYNHLAGVAKKIIKFLTQNSWYFCKV